MPKWLEWATDISQIVIAFGTVGAVWSAIWLARRAERPRLKTFLYSNVRMERDESKRRTRVQSLQLEVVNTGIPPIHVRSIRLYVPQRGGRSTGFDAQPGSGKISPDEPYRVEHGQALSSFVGIGQSSYAWRSLPLSMRFWNHPHFRIITTLGKTYRHRLPLHIIRHIEREVSRVDAEMQKGKHKAHGPDH